MVVTDESVEDETTTVEDDMLAVVESEEDEVADEPAHWPSTQLPLAH